MNAATNLKYPHSVRVGIMSDKNIRFRLHGVFICDEAELTGEQNVCCCDGKISWHGKQYDTLHLEPATGDETFTLCDVTIGKQFHWERHEDETFGGSLEIVVDNDMLTAINKIDIEYYLASVISSEMSATSSLEYLRAQAVVSRSWLMRILVSRFDTTTNMVKTPSEHSANEIDDDTLIRWYENDAHILYDVCADDHCQRYEGFTHAESPIVSEAVRSTSGEVLMYDGRVCDARFSKCCGGMTERFSACWDEHDEDYLVVEPDCDRADKNEKPDLSVESEAERWIRTIPKAFCNCADTKILSQVLKDYDFETKDFYRWHIVYTQEELSEMLRTKLGIDFGQVRALVPVSRGGSGRLTALKIIGTKRTLTIGKELEIRRALSPSHLKSSAFVVGSNGKTTDGVPATFELKGAGWGHGVGMCQIGAAVMAAQGRNYRSILKHYYKNAEIVKL